MKWYIVLPFVCCLVAAEPLSSLVDKLRIRYYTIHGEGGQGARVLCASMYLSEPNDQVNTTTQCFSTVEGKPGQEGWNEANYREYYASLPADEDVSVLENYEGSHIIAKTLKEAKNWVNAKDEEITYDVVDKLTSFYENEDIRFYEQADDEVELDVDNREIRCQDDW